MFEIGDFVYWRAIVQDKPIERAGQIVGIVPPNTPLALVPMEKNLWHKNQDTTRPELSYMIHVPGVPYVFWPNAAHLKPLTDNKLYVLETQPKSKAHFILHKVDRSDRTKLKEMAVMLKDGFQETANMLEIRAWSTRFWFDVVDNVEVIVSVDRW